VRELLINYLAFGSNLTPARLFARVGVCPVVGVASVPGYRMAFRKRGNDDSGKCDLFKSTVNDVAEGVVFALPEEKRAVLDRFEGVGNGYEVVEIDADIDGTIQRVVAYQAQPPFIDDDLKPYRWYRDFVLEGGRRFGLSPAWIEQVESTAFMEDSNEDRAARNRRILGLSDDEAQRMSDAGSST